MGCASTLNGSQMLRVKVMTWIQPSLWHHCNVTMQHNLRLRYQLYQLYNRFNLLSMMQYYNSRMRLLSIVHFNKHLNEHLCCVCSSIDIFKTNNNLFCRVIDSINDNVEVVYVKRANKICSEASGDRHLYIYKSSV